MGQFIIEIFTPINQTKDDHPGSNHPYLKIKFKGERLKTEIWGHDHIPTFTFNVANNDTEKFTFYVFNQDKGIFEQDNNLIHSQYLGQLNLSVQALLRLKMTTPVWIDVASDNGSYPFCKLKFHFSESSRMDRHERAIPIVPIIAQALPLLP